MEKKVRFSITMREKDVRRLDVLIKKKGERSRSSLCSKEITKALDIFEEHLRNKEPDLYDNYLEELRFRTE